MAVDAAVVTAFKARDTGMSATLKRITANSKRFGDTSARSFAKASASARGHQSVLKGILQAGVVVGGLHLIKRGLEGIVKATTMIEDAEAAFTPLMGGAAGAQKLVEALNKTAKTTPFQFEQIAKTAQQLLPVMNKDIGLTIETFRQMGDVAGGNAQNLERITRGFTKALLKGKPDMEALNMIGEAGVPIFKEMAKSMGVADSAIFELSKQGKLTNEDLKKTFRDMTSEGGLFFNAMDIASKTLSGRFSTFKDTAIQAAGAFGKTLSPVMKEVMESAIKIADSILLWVKANKEIIKQKVTSFFVAIKTTLKILWPIMKGVFAVFKFFAPLLPVVVAGMIAYNAAVKVNLALIAIAPFLRFVRVFILMSKAKGIATAAQWALNVAMSANPIGLVIIAIAALIAIVVLLVFHWDTVKKKFMEWTAIFDNPVFANIAMIFAPFITIPILIARNWDFVIGKLKLVATWLAKVSGLSAVFGLAQAAFGKSKKPDAAADRPKDDKSSRELAKSRAQTQNLNARVGVDFNNAPKGTTATASRQPGLAVSTTGLQ